MTWHLTVDAGNSQLALVLYQNERRVDGLRLRTHPHPEPRQIVDALQQFAGPQPGVGFRPTHHQ